jgi:methylenetetrahydrofolate dehydrogenase (NADP+)/methenyltetrahydrofolate cyclohydrolase
MLLDGKAKAASIRADVSARVQQLRATGIVPTLGIVVATDDGGSAWYVRSLTKAAEKAGLRVVLVDQGPTATHDQIAGAVRALNDDATVHGIILQAPVPAGVSFADLASLVRPDKDVDGVNPLSAGRLAAGQPAFAPATAAAVMALLASDDQTVLRGANAVVLGRSLVVGKPTAQLLLAQDATVTICHSRTRDVQSITRAADVLVVAVGRPRFVGAEFVGPGAVVIDVGTNEDAGGSLVGDVDLEAVAPIARAVSPVPGGVGPVTTALLLRNVVTAATPVISQSS